MLPAARLAVQQRSLVHPTQPTLLLSGAECGRQRTSLELIPSQRLDAVILRLGGGILPQGGGVC